MVIAQSQYGTQKKRRSLLYQKNLNEQSPELTVSIQRRNHFELSGAKSEAFFTGKLKPSVYRQSLSSRQSLPFTARSISTRNSQPVNYYREKQRLLQEIGLQVRTSQAIQGRISAFKRQEERSVKRMQNLERVYKYTEETRKLKRQSQERIEKLEAEKVVWAQEKRKQVETVKISIDLYKGIKQKEIEQQKQEIVKEEKQRKVVHQKIRELEKAHELQAKQVVVAKVKAAEVVGA